MTTFLYSYLHVIWHCCEWLWFKSFVFPLYRTHSKIPEDEKLFKQKYIIETVNVKIQNISMLSSPFSARCQPYCHQWFLLSWFGNLRDIKEILQEETLLSWNYGTISRGNVNIFSWYDYFNVCTSQWMIASLWRQ